LAEKEEHALKLKHDLEIEHQEILKQLEEAEKEAKELDETEKT
jgi:hypothetical protein